MRVRIPVGYADGVNVDWTQAISFDSAYLRTPEDIEAAKKAVQGLPAEVGLKRTLEGRDKEPLSPEDWARLNEIVANLQSPRGA